MSTPPSRPLLREVVESLPSYVAGRRASGAEVAALASNESHYDPLPEVVNVVRAAAGRMNRYPDMGALALRARIAAHIGATASEIAVGPGSVGVLQQILSALCDAGDEVVFAWRSFEAYPILAGVAGAVAVRVPLTADERHDFPAMSRMITERTRVVIICSPNNPTSIPAGHRAVEEFIATVPGRVLVVLDEAYVEYADGEADDALDALALLRIHPNVCVLRTFSKAYGLAGLRVGYAVANKVLADGLHRTALPFGVSDLAQRAAIASLDAHEQMRERVAQVTAERSRVTRALRDIGWQVPDGQANFVWLRCDETRRALLSERLESSDVLVRGYAGDGIRITLADRATNDRVLRLLADAAEDAE